MEGTRAAGAGAEEGGGSEREAGAVVVVEEEVLLLLLTGAAAEAAAAAALAAAGLAAAAAAAEGVLAVAEGVWDEEALLCDWVEKAAAAWKCAKLRLHSSRKGGRDIRHNEYHICCACNS